MNVHRDLSGACLAVVLVLVPCTPEKKVPCRHQAQCSEDFGQRSVPLVVRFRSCMCLLIFFLVVLGENPSTSPADIFCHVLSVIEKRILKSPTNGVNLPFNNKFCSSLLCNILF